MPGQRKRLTLRRYFLLTVWWLMAVIMPPLAIVIGCVFGAVSGAATGMIKGIDESVFQTIKAVKESRFNGGVQQFGLAEKGVGYIYDEHNQPLIPASVRTTLDSLAQQIISGRIRVPSSREASAK